MVGIGAFRYAPPIALVMAPLGLIPWPAYAALVTAVQPAVIRWIQIATSVAALSAVLLSTRLASGAVSYVTTNTASQVVSPLMWDYYAVLLVMPITWLLDRNQWWAACLLPVLWIPLARL